MDEAEKDCILGFDNYSAYQYISFSLLFVTFKWFTRTYSVENIQEQN